MKPQNLVQSLEQQLAHQYMRLTAFDRGVISIYGHSSDFEIYDVVMTLQDSFKISYTTSSVGNRW